MKSIIHNSLASGLLTYRESKNPEKSEFGPTLPGFRCVALGFLFSVLFAMNPAIAADMKNGEKLHEKNCAGCHLSLSREDADLSPDSSHKDANWLYTREDRRVNSLPELEKQVENCQISLRLQWFDQEIDDVTAYLNREFYRF